jgi:hypothetical protein
VRRTRRPAADPERSQDDFYCQRGKNGADGCSDIEGKATRVGASERGQRMSFNESHYTDKDGRALATDHPKSAQSECPKLYDNSRYCFGAREATIFSNRGSPRNGSHNGSNRSEP